MRSGFRIGDGGIQAVALQKNAIELQIFCSRVAKRRRKQRKRWKIIVQLQCQRLLETAAGAGPMNFHTLSQLSELPLRGTDICMRQVKSKIAHRVVADSHLLSCIVSRIIQREQLAAALEATLQIARRSQHKLCG